MCTRGIWQLEKLTFRYCAHSGSSRGIRCALRVRRLPRRLLSSSPTQPAPLTASVCADNRELFETPRFVEYAQQYPSVQFESTLKPGRHPVLIGNYCACARPCGAAAAAPIPPTLARLALLLLPCRSHENRVADTHLSPPPPHSPTRAAVHPRTAVNGKEKVADLKNKYKADVYFQMDRMVQTSGRKMTKISKPIVSRRQSVQGIWQPGFDSGVEFKATHKL